MSPPSFDAEICYTGGNQTRGYGNGAGVGYQLRHRSFGPNGNHEARKPRFCRMSVAHSTSLGSSTCNDLLQHSSRSSTKTQSSMYGRVELLITFGLVVSNVVCIAKLLSHAPLLVFKARLHAYVLLNVVLVALLCLVLFLKTHFAPKKYKSLCRYVQVVSFALAFVMSSFEPRTCTSI